MMYILIVILPHYKQSCDKRSNYYHRYCETIETFSNITFRISDFVRGFFTRSDVRLVNRQNIFGLIGAVNRGIGYIIQIRIQKFNFLLVYIGAGIILCVKYDSHKPELPLLKRYLIRI